MFFITLQSFFARTAAALSLMTPGFIMGPVVAQASDYPPGYVIGSEVKETQSVKVTTQNRVYGSAPTLRIQYTGALLANHWGRINAVITLNGRTHMFKMSNYNFSEELSVGQYRNVTRCVHSPVPVSGQPPCRPSVSPSSNWDFDLPSPAEQDLFFYAKRPGNIGNAWDVSIAFVSEDGTWDNNFGQNFMFRFE